MQTWNAFLDFTQKLQHKSKIRFQTEFSCTYADQQGGDRRAVLVVDHGQQAGQVTFSGSREAQPAGGHVTQPIRSRDKEALERDGAEGLTWRRWTGSRWSLRRWTEPRRSAWWRRTFPATSPRTSGQQNNRRETAWTGVGQFLPDQSLHVRNTSEDDDRPASEARLTISKITQKLLIDFDYSSFKGVTLPQPTEV